MAKQIKNIPKADHLMGSMRSMGYTFEAAVSDIIDNSISGHSRNIQLNFPTEALHCFVSIIDDGDGMTKEELFNAMRYGSTASETERKDSDLGRFGLGLKAASLSQCRVLTVVSKKDSEICAYRWDYKYILKNKDWYILELSESDLKSVPSIEQLRLLEHGTLVTWEDFDVIEKFSNGQTYATLCDYKDLIVKYMGLTFHRYIGSKKGDRVTMRLNNHKIAALDPFLEYHSKTTRKKEVTVALNDSNGIERQIKVQPFILPFYKDLSQTDIDKLGGIENMRTKQGYYVYRNNRLIISGTWFGMHSKDELSKNARIRVDIPNTLDDIWKIDIKKQNATIPKAIQVQLKRKVEEAMGVSIRQQTHRGRKNNIKGHIDYIWNRIEGRDNGYYYEVNRGSELISFVKHKIPDEYIAYVDMLIDELERSIPIQQMYVDQSNNSIIEKDDPNRMDDIFQKAVLMVDFTKEFSNPKDVIEKLFNSEPFCDHRELKERLYKHYNI